MHPPESVKSSLQTIRSDFELFEHYYHRSEHPFDSDTMDFVRHTYETFQALALDSFLLDDNKQEKVVKRMLSFWEEMVVPTVSYSIRTQLYRSAGRDLLDRKLKEISHLPIERRLEEFAVVEKGRISIIPQLTTIARINTAGVIQYIKEALAECDRRNEEERARVGGIPDPRTLTSSEDI